MNAHEKLNYVEFAARDVPATKSFFEKAFAWAFVDYGPEYTAFSGQGLDGGFFRASLCSTPATGGALLVFYSADLEATLAKVEAAGGHVVKPVFDFREDGAFTSPSPAATSLRCGPTRGCE